MGYNKREFTEGVSDQRIGPTVQAENTLILRDDFSTDPGASGWVLPTTWEWDSLQELLTYNGSISYDLT